jgi:hypothetical protein
MVVRLTRLTHKMAIELYLMAESSTSCSSRSRRPVRKLLNTSWYFFNLRKMLEKPNIADEWLSV